MEAPVLLVMNVYCRKPEYLYVVIANSNQFISRIGLNRIVDHARGIRSDHRAA